MNTNDNKKWRLHSRELNDAIAKRNEYFNSLSTEKKEEALRFQEFIDSELKKAGNQNNRLAIMQKLLRESVYNLKVTTHSLSSTLLEISHFINKSSKDKNDK